MALTPFTQQAVAPQAPPSPPATSPGLPPINFDWDGWSSSAEMQGLLSKYGHFLPLQPSGEDIPTLQGSPAEMDLSTAQRVHIQASRWLEFIVTQVQLRRAEQILFAAEGHWLLKTLNYRYKGKLERAREEEFERLRSVEMTAEKLKAELVVLEGVKSSLDQVKAAASRAITAQTKTNTPVGSLQ